MAIDMNNNQEKQVLSWNDLSEDQLDQLEHSYEFKSAEEEFYPFAFWHNGYNDIVEFNQKQLKMVPTGEKVKGLVFKHKGLPDDLNAVFETLAELKPPLAKLITVKHKNKDEEGNDLAEYWQLVMDKVRFFPLMTGLPKLAEMAEGLIYRGPICNYDLNPNKKKGVYSFNKNLSILLVVDALYEYGYRDENGLPKLIRFRANSYACTGLNGNVLRRHNQVAGWAISKGLKFGPKNEAAEPYMFGFRFIDTHEEDHGSNPDKTSKAIAVDASIPKSRDLTDAYINEMYAGPELHAKMKRLLYVPIMQRGKLSTALEGPIIKWGIETTERAIARYKKYNPSPEELLHYGEHPLTSRMVAILNGEVRAQEASNGEDAAKLQIDPKQMLKQIKTLIDFFTEQDNEDAISILEEARDQLEDPDSDADGVKSVREVLDAYTATREEIKNNRPVSEDDPF